MKLKIISNGTTRGSRIVDADTDEALDDVVGVTWSLYATTGVASATVELRTVAVEVEVPASRLIDVTQLGDGERRYRKPPPEWLQNKSAVHVRARTFDELLEGVSAAGIRITDDWHWRMSDETRRVLAEDAKVQLSARLFGHELRIDPAMPLYEVDIA